MAINFSVTNYLPAQNIFGRSITVYPIKSQPGEPAYVARGILETRGTAIQTDAGMVVMSDQETILDIREAEFGVMPVQGDLIEIPAENSIPAAGTFEITDAAWNGGGEVTLTIRRYEPPSNTFVIPTAS
jgi:ribosomal protein S8E